MSSAPDPIHGIPGTASGETQPLSDDGWMMRMREALLPAAPVQHAAAPGGRIGAYTIVRMIGQGGMGSVYEAEQLRPRRQVALKLIQGGLSADSVTRFELEAEVLGRLQHPGIAQIYEAGATESVGGAQPFFAMELVAGISLTEYASQHRLSIRERLDLVARIADAVQHAHTKGVIHRDLKPGNILVTREGQPKVLDFGVARLADPSRPEATLHTTAGQVVGTLPYMSPEQVSGDPRLIDARCDIYALGVVLFELLTGQRPHDLSELSVPEAVRRLREDEPLRLARLRPGMRGDIDTIVHTALARDRERRYATASALADDLRRHLHHEPIAARPASALYQLTRFARRHRVLVGGALGILVALGIGLAASTLFYLRAEDARVNAERAQGRAEDEAIAARRAQRQADESAQRAEQSEAQTRRLLAEAYMQTAQSDAQRGDWTAALRSYGAAKEAGFADTVLIELGKIEAWCGSNRFDLALPALRRLADAPHADAHRARILLARAANDIEDLNDDEADAALRQAIAIGLPPAEDALARGLLAEDVPTAIQCFEQSLKHNPYQFLANFNLGVTLALAGRVEEAAAHLRLAEIVHPQDGTLLMGQLIIAMLQADRPESERLIDRYAERASPDDAAIARLLLEMTFALLPLERWMAVDREEARRVLLSQYAQAALILAQVSMTQGVSTLTASEESPVFELTSRPPGSFGRVLRVYTSAMSAAIAGNIEEADALFAKAVRLNPEGFGLWIHSGFRRRLGDLEGAERGLLAAIEQPSLIPIRRIAQITAIELGIERASAMQGDEALAKRREVCLRLQEYMPLPPLRVDLYAAFVQLALQAGDVAIARSLLLAWQKAAADDPARAWVLAEIELAEGDAAGALHHARLAHAQSADPERLAIFEARAAETAP